MYEQFKIDVGKVEKGLDNFKFPQAREIFAEKYDQNYNKNVINDTELCIKALGGKEEKAEVSLTFRC